MVAEFYPRASDPVLGVWAHRQAIAARDAGAEVRVLVLNSVVPRGDALRAGDVRGALAPLAQRRHAELDGIEITYVPFLAPVPRTRTIGSWGARAAPALGRALARLHADFRYELVHAHYAVPAGDAALRVAPHTPLVVSVHGGDVLWTHGRSPRARRAVTDTFARARLVLANSRGIERRCRALGAERTRVVTLGADLQAPLPATTPPVLVTLSHLVPRKRHVDVLRALPALPDCTWVIVGDGPERRRLEAEASRLGVADRVTFRGQLAPAEARSALRGAAAMVLPSEDEAFGVAYVEALAAGVPAIGCAGENGPEDIAAAGPGLVLVPPRDPAGLAAGIRAALADPGLRAAARATAGRSFTWERCGRATVAAYAEALT